MVFYLEKNLDWSRRSWKAWKKLGNLGGAEPLVSIGWVHWTWERCERWMTPVVMNVYQTCVFCVFFIYSLTWRMMIRCHVHVLRKHLHLCDQKKLESAKKKRSDSIWPMSWDPVDSIHHGSIHKRREAFLVLRAKKGIRHILLNVAAVKNAQVCFWHGSF